MGRISYSGVVLDNVSRNKLIDMFRSIIPLEYEIIAHHMTINMGALVDGSREKFDMEHNTPIPLRVVDYAIDNLVIAVGVEGYSSKNEKPHITLAVNRKAGGKPYLSNKLTNWKPIERPFIVTGKVEEVEYG